ncbi:pyrroline-5-carboxylate reductase [Sphingomonas sp.]|uniref:pyrroline-5-carboxylate reductase family protein n=1 Tax=Sphingomonas sp. TaxID=28214 RepID=UPI00286C7C01|nr:pyrroline-5-carboxylate reductase [Sphingomonas sp.]
MTPQLPGATWIIGCGKMAGAMVAGWQRAGVDFSEALAVRPSGNPVEGIRTLQRLSKMGGKPRLVLLGVKPQKLDEVAPTLAKHLNKNTILVSILAGVEIASLRARFPQAGQIVRVMPNLPVSEGRGVVALTGGDGAIDALFGLLGTVVRTDSEADLAAVGSLAGAGPAYVARFIAALAKAGVERGLAPETADRIALETVLGTAAMASASGETMASIAVRVASPNGTTQAGLEILDQELDQLVSRTIAAASRRGQELAEAARIDSPRSLA